VTSLPTKPVVLVGMPGAGKSTVGRVLAARLGREFVDLDERVEAEAQASISEIFASEAESGFRRRESAALRDALAEPNVVIAAGGGAPMFGDNLQLMLASATVVHVSASLEVLIERIGDGVGRPLFVGGVRATLARLLPERLSTYARAHFSVDGNGPPSQVAATVIALLGDA